MRVDCHRSRTSTSRASTILQTVGAALKDLGVQEGCFDAFSTVGLVTAGLVFDYALHDLCSMLDCPKFTTLRIAKSIARSNACTVEVDSWQLRLHQVPPAPNDHQRLRVETMPCR
jgi:hypothetical protein